MTRLPIVFITLLLFQLATASPQERVTLAPGDKLPPFKVGKWLKGSGPKNINKGLVIIDFWATWCGPCIEMMPELSKLAAANPDIYVAGISVLERDISAEKLRAFVQSKSDRMQFNVAGDQSEFIAKNWFAKAAIRQLPTTLLAKDGVIQWIGHPENLSATLLSVREGRHDVAKTRQNYINEGEKGLRERAFTELLYKVDSQLDEPDASKGIEAFKLIQSNYPEFQAMAEDWKLKFLLRTDLPKAEELIRDLMEKKSYNKLSLNLTYVRFESAIAKNAANELMKIEGIKNPMTYFFLANFFIIAKMKSEALAAVEKAEAAYKALGKDLPDIQKNIEMKRKQAEALPGLTSTSVG